MNEIKEKIKVLKKDSSTENFDPGKIARVVKAAGLDREEAAILAARISQWVTSQEKPQISSAEIRKKVIEELQKTNQYAAKLYTWYKKNHDSN